MLDNKLFKELNVLVIEVKEHMPYHIQNEEDIIINLIPYTIAMSIISL